MDKTKTETMEKDQPQKKKLSNALKYFFGVGDAGFVLMSNVETFYFMTFLTNFANFVPAVAGVINSVFSIIDACLSWIYGGILNSTKAKKWGRYRSWLVLTPWIVPFIFACQFIRFSENEWLSAIIIIIAAVVSHVFWNIGYVANATMVSVVGKTPEDKATISSSRATWNNIGGLIWSYAGLPFATWLGSVIGEKYQWAAAAFILGWVMVLAYYAHFKMTKGYEDIEDEQHAAVAKQNKISVAEMFKSLFQNPQLIILMLADLAKWCVKFVTAASAIYYFRDAAGNAGLMVPYALCIALAAMAGAFIVRYWVKVMPARTITIISYIGMAIFLLLIYTGYANATMVIVFMTVAQFFYGVAFASSPALYADTVTYTTWKTGKNAAGWIMGLQNLPLKIAVFLRGTIVAAALTAVSWEKDVLLEGAARQGMTVAFALIPAIFCAVGAVLLIVGFRITKDKVERYQAEIDARIAAEAK